MNELMVSSAPRIGDLLCEGRKRHSVQQVQVSPQGPCILYFAEGPASELNLAGASLSFLPLHPVPSLTHKTHPEELPHC